MAEGMNAAPDVMKPNLAQVVGPASMEPRDVCASVLNIPKVGGAFSPIGLVPSPVWPCTILRALHVEPIANTPSGAT